ncbi:MAG: glycosyltransferase [Ignavibacteriales bacterium]|nr:MAG: glycosyltransferase [Ignavibacteriales bacterium]
MKPEISVIISFYNKIKYLELLLAGFQNQTFNNFEIIIADDGSTQDVVKKIESIASTYPFTVKHIWQDDKGFRKNRILNKAILASSSDYLLFVDGDCIPHYAFVEEHFNHKEEKICLTGRRVNLSQKITNQLTSQRVEEKYLENNLLKLIDDGLFGKSIDVEKGFYFRNSYLRKIFNKKKRGLLGCNFSIHKKDLIDINGFDERYEAPSIGEDTDIQYRLELNGVEIKSLNNIAVQYHLFHKLQERNPVNFELFNSVKQSGTYFTSFGIKS